jgi:hypothetical protein
MESESDDFLGSEPSDSNSEEERDASSSDNSIQRKLTFEDLLRHLYSILREVNASILNYAFNLHRSALMQIVTIFAVVCMSPFLTTAPHWQGVLASLIILIILAYCFRVEPNPEKLNSILMMLVLLASWGIVIALVLHYLGEGESTPAFFADGQITLLMVLTFALTIRYSVLGSEGLAVRKLWDILPDESTMAFQLLPITEDRISCPSAIAHSTPPSSEYPTIAAFQIAGNSESVPKYRVFSVSELIAMDLPEAPSNGEQAAVQLERDSVDAFLMAWFQERVAEDGMFPWSNLRPRDLFDYFPTQRVTLQCQPSSQHHSNSNVEVIHRFLPTEFLQSLSDPIVTSCIEKLVGLSRSTAERTLEHHLVERWIALCQLDLKLQSGQLEILEGFVGLARRLSSAGLTKCISKVSSTPPLAMLEASPLNELHRWYQHLHSSNAAETHEFLEHVVEHLLTEFEHIELEQRPEDVTFKDTRKINIVIGTSFLMAGVDAVLPASKR